MAMRRRRRGEQADLFVTADRLPQSDGHVFFVKLNQLLAEGGFDEFVATLCGPHDADARRVAGRRSPLARYS